MNIQAYLSFEGNCKDAFHFYQSIFGGRIINRQTYQDQIQDLPEHYRDKLQHAELVGDGFHIMGNDASPDANLTSGTKIQMSIDLDDKDKGKDIFDALVKDGKLLAAYQKTSWGEYYGRLTDKYGVHWMINAK
ncbi:VOC family protein [Psychroflexus sp. YR1-1]|uniref:VOC family protein n=1 Tax=Psychroflexus aurantiacus TaxID=2709310 RepID=A0A6B3R670_9FLAO|nr:VOC family protein [Psychroflexus aurantiacus]NEV94617.1 VOC family protein [Psychroflexus aurantiacus]